MIRRNLETKLLSIQIVYFVPVKEFCWNWHKKKIKTRRNKKIRNARHKITFKPQVQCTSCQCLVWRGWYSAYFSSLSASSSASSQSSIKLWFFEVPPRPSCRLTTSAESEPKLRQASKVKTWFKDLFYKLITTKYLSQSVKIYLRPNSRNRISLNFGSLSTTASKVTSGRRRILTSGASKTTSSIAPSKYWPQVNAGTWRTQSFARFRNQRRKYFLFRRLLPRFGSRSGMRTRQMVLTILLLRPVQTTYAANLLQPVTDSCVLRIVGFFIFCISLSLSTRLQLVWSSLYSEFLCKLTFENTQICLRGDHGAL